MNTENKTELYVSPEVEVIEINARQVIWAHVQNPVFRHRFFEV